MLQRILGGVLVLLGLVSVALGVASATVWRAPDRVVATAEPAGDGSMVVSDPGVLGLVSDDVTVTASVPEGQEVTLAVGRDVDVLGWVGKDPYSQVTGLRDDWETLDVEAGQAAGDDGDNADKSGDEADKAAKPSGADPAGSDMWVAETSDKGSATLRWSDRPGRWTLLAAGVGDEAQAPTLTFTWPRTAATPYLWPAVGAGAALVVVGLVLFVVGTRKRRDHVPAVDGGETRHEPEGSGSEVGAMAPFAPVHGVGPAADPVAGQWPEPWQVAPAEEASATDEPTTDDPTTDDPTTDDPAIAGSGTAEVPLAGRLLRRSRRRSGAAETSAGTSAAPPAPTGPAETVEPDAADAAPDVAPAPVLPVPGAEPSTATGSVPMTRRELRAQEEARRAAEQGGVTRMLRAITGSIPTVRQPQGPTDEASASSSDPSSDLSTAAGRAAAWRATWGFGQTTGQSTDQAGPGAADMQQHEHDTTDGENR